MAFGRESADGFGFDVGVVPSATHSHIYAGGESLGIARLEDDSGVGADEFGNAANVRSHHRCAGAERLYRAEGIIFVAF